MMNITPIQQFIVDEIEAIGRVKLISLLYFFLDYEHLVLGKKKQEEYSLSNNDFTSLHKQVIALFEAQTEYLGLYQLKLIKRTLATQAWKEHLRLLDRQVAYHILRSKENWLDPLRKEDWRNLPSTPLYVIAKIEKE